MSPATDIRCCGKVVPSSIITITYRGIVHSTPYKAHRGGTCQQCGSIIRQEVPLQPQYIPMVQFTPWENIRRYIRGNRDTTYYDKNLDPLVAGKVGPCANCPWLYFDNDADFHAHWVKEHD